MRFAGAHVLLSIEIRHLTYVVLVVVFEIPPRLNAYLPLITVYGGQRVLLLARFVLL